MGRSNTAARQRNTRLNRREKGAPRSRNLAEKVANMPRVAAEELVIPDGQCLRNPRRPKAKFNTEKKAAAALRQAQQQRRRTGASNIEKRYYPCSENEGGCGGYHLTSRESYDPAWKRTT